MKKFLSVLLACISFVMCIFLGTACSEKPNLDIREAADNLRARDYVVEIDYNQDYLGIKNVIETMLYAEREGSDSTSYVYIVQLESSKAAKYQYEYMKSDAEWKIEKYETSLEYAENILKLYQDDLRSETVKAYEDAIQEYKQNIKEYQQELDCIGYSGKYLWIASSTEVLKDMK